LRSRSIAVSRIILSLFFFVSFGICAQEPPLTAAEPGATGENATLAASGTYILQRRDVIEIKVYDLPEVSGTVAIRPDGKISVPLLNDVVAAGLTPDHLAANLTQGYKHEFRNPRVTVIVRSFSNQNVFVGGEVDKPGLLPLDSQMTVLQAILRAGGVKETAKQKGVILLRNDGHGKPEVRQLSLLAVADGAPDILLQPFDVVLVPKTKVAQLNKWIDQNIRKMIPMGLGFDFSYLLNGTATVF
jgi:polysaccharide biosynthesis/export protein